MNDERKVWWLCEGCSYSVLAARRPAQCEGCGTFTTPWLRVDLGGPRD
jgi:rubrerythrin